jgi:hypothetical protein
MQLFLSLNMLHFLVQNWVTVTLILCDFGCDCDLFRTEKCNIFRSKTSYILGTQNIEENFKHYCHIRHKESS